jgi:hypothetical protein
MAAFEHFVTYTVVSSGRSETVTDTALRYRAPRISTHIRPGPVGGLQFDQVAGTVSHVPIAMSPMNLLTFPIV